MAKKCKSEIEYDRKYGDFLITYATHAGNLMSRFKSSFKIPQRVIDIWMNGELDGSGKEQDFIDKYETAKHLRIDHYYDQVKKYKMDKNVFAMLMWSEFKEVVTPPKEANTNVKSDVTMSVDNETLNHIMDSLKHSKTAGFD